MAPRHQFQPALRHLARAHQPEPVHFNPQPGNSQPFVEPRRIQRGDRFSFAHQVAGIEQRFGLFQLPVLDQNAYLFRYDHGPQTVEPAFDRDKMRFLQHRKRRSEVAIGGRQPGAHEISRRDLIDEAPLSNRRHVLVDQPGCLVQFAAFV